MSRPWTSTEIEKAVELRKAGVSWCAIGRLCGHAARDGRSTRGIVLQAAGVDPFTGAPHGEDEGPCLPTDGELDQFIRPKDPRTADLSKGRPAWMSPAAYRMERSRRRMERNGGIADPVDAHLQRGGLRPAILCV